MYPLWVCVSRWRLVGGDGVAFVVFPTPDFSLSRQRVLRCWRRVCELHRSVVLLLGNAFGVVFPGAGVVDWFSGKVVEGGRRAKLEESTADDLSPSISCSFPKLGVHSLISKGEDGRLKIRFAALAGGKQWRKSVRRKMMNSSGKDLVVIRRLLRDLSVRMEYTVLSFSI